MVTDLALPDQDKKISWFSLLFIITVMLMPHIMLLHNILPLKAMGKSLWLGGFVISTAFCCIYAVISLKNVNTWLFVLISSFLFMIPALIRSEVYDLPIMADLIQSRSLILIPLMFIGATFYGRDKRVFKILLWTIITTGFLQAVIGILHKYAFPDIVTGTFASYKGKFFYVDSIHGRTFYSRESGTMGNPTQYADLICLAACLFAWIKPKFIAVPKLVKIIIYLAFYSILLIGMMPSLCRLPIVFTFLFMCFSFVEVTFKNLKRLILPSAALFGLVVLFVFYKYPQLIERFTNVGAYGRIQKNELLLNVLTSNWTFFLIGITNDIKTSVRSLENLGFGDNSYLQLLAACGFPVVLAWLVNIWLCMKNQLSFDKSLLKVFFIIYVIINTVVGDPIWADGWSMFLLLSSVFLFSQDPWESVQHQKNS